MSKLLFKIPLVHWIRSTIERMNTIGKDDFPTWSDFWFLTYKDLGGKSESSGAKECPKHAAYGLWRLGRISNSGQSFQNWTLEKINQEYGKNTAYAILALDLIEKQRGKRDTKNDWSESELWSNVQELYQQKLRILPAESSQGAVKIALFLFMEGRIVSTLQ